MEIGITIVVIAVGIGFIVWLKRRGKVTLASAPREGISRQALAHKAFVHGNTCLVEGEIAAAIASFQQAIELAPDHPHAASRLLEAEQRQAAQTNELAYMDS